MAEREREAERYIMKSELGHIEYYLHYAIRGFEIGGSLSNPANPIVYDIVMTLVYSE